MVAIHEFSGIQTLGWTLFILLYY